MAGLRGEVKRRVVQAAARGSDGGGRPTETQTMAALIDHGKV